MRRRDRGGAPTETVGTPLWLQEGTGLPAYSPPPCLQITLHASTRLGAAAACAGQGLTSVTVTSTPWTDVLSPISVLVPGLRTFTLAWVRSCFGHRPL